MMKKLNESLMKDVKIKQLEMEIEQIKKGGIKSQFDTNKEK